MGGPSPAQSQQTGLATRTTQPTDRRTAGPESKPPPDPPPPDPPPPDSLSLSATSVLSQAPTALPTTRLTKAVGTRHNGSFKGFGVELVNDSLLELFESFQKDVAASFKRYECAMHRVMQADHGDASADIVQKIRSRKALPVRMVASEDSLGRNPFEEDIQQVTLLSEEDIQVSRPSMTANGLQGVLEAKPFDCHRTTSPLSRHQKPSANRIRNSGTLKVSGGDIPINRFVSDVVAMDPQEGFLSRLSHFKFNTKPLVSEKSRMRKMMASRKYTSLRILGVLLDILLIIIQIQLFSDKLSRHQDTYEDPIFRYFVLVICVFFWFDLLAALALEFPRFDLLIGQTGYRLLHIVALVQQTLHLVGAFALPSQRYTSMFRIWVEKALFVRLIRTIVILPPLSRWAWKQKLGEMQVMIQALTGTAQALLWCALMFLAILVPCGVYFTEEASVYIAQLALGMPRQASDQLLIRNWGNLCSSIYSLFQAMLGGSDWGDMYDSLSVLNILSKAIFIAFIFFTYISLLNTVTAVFIKCAFSCFERDKEFIVQQELDCKLEYLLGVKQIFSDLDEDGNGKIVLRQLVESMQRPDVAAYFSKLGLDTNEVEKLPVFFHADCSGYISKEEFMLGCLRLKGRAKSLD